MQIWNSEKVGIEACQNFLYTETLVSGCQNFLHESQIHCQQKILHRKCQNFPGTRNLISRYQNSQNPQGITLCFRPQNTQKMDRVEGILQKKVFFNKMLPTGRILKNKFIFRFFVKK